jgi:type I restriction enzyme S subunit
MIKFRWEKEFKETEIGEIPKDWEILRIGDIATIKSGKRPDTIKEFGVYQVWGANGLMGYTDNNSFVATEESLITGRVGSLGNIFYIEKDSKVWFSDNVLVIYPDRLKTNLKYLYFQLLTRKDDILSLDVGSTQPLLTQSALKNLLIPYPSLAEQTRIANVLSWFDDLIENKKRQNEILEKTAMEIFKNWFIDFEPFKNEEFVIMKNWEERYRRGGKLKN